MLVFLKNNNVCIFFLVLGNVLMAPAIKPPMDFRSQGWPGDRNSPRVNPMQGRGEPNQPAASKLIMLRGNHRDFKGPSALKGVSNYPPKINGTLKNEKPPMISLNKRLFEPSQTEVDLANKKITLENGLKNVNGHLGAKESTEDAMGTFKVYKFAPTNMDQGMNNNKDYNMAVQIFTPPSNEKCLQTFLQNLQGSPHLPKITVNIVNMLQLDCKFFFSHFKSILIEGGFMVDGSNLTRNPFMLAIVE